jgi:hypothetical protein
MAAETTTDAQAHTDSAAQKTGEAAGAAAAAADVTKAVTGAAAEAATAATTTTKADETPGSEPARKDDPAKTESKAPEKYELKIPETGAAYVDPADLAHLETMARTAGWSNEDAQAALDEHVATIQAQAARYLAETTADTQYGGAKLSESQRLAQTAIDRIRPVGHQRREAFLRFLGRGGAGNHPEVIGFLADLGQQMGEDRPTHARSSDAGGKGAAAILYDHPDSQKLNS